MTDFIIDNLGSICLVRAMNEAGSEWIDFNCSPEPWQLIAGGLAIEPRCPSDLVDGLRDDGFTVE